MTVFYVSLFVCIVWFGSYIHFGKKKQHKKDHIRYQNLLLRSFYQQEIENMKFDLVGLGIGENSDYEFIQAVHNVVMPDDLRVQIYD